MKFISLERHTHINPAHVASYSKLRNGLVRFEMSNGKTITGKPDYEDFEEEFCPIIPAQLGYEVVFARKHDGDWFYSAQPVVAWRERPGAVIPICAFGKREPEEYVGTKLPDGKYVDIDEYIYSSIEALKYAFEEEAGD